ncbi:MAG: hypothetical protein L0332_03810 [Chloroflexi bacterium]|nr:hypothetical protein [Chloroflexota bacterium]MCI0575875.1 hypothetical protein [Chloroflexota bacterium]MCI0648899.1 hypothetical protein [Chloroflexota bacterium]MCI0725837.1 hypothetical protein [Chloroflexota bacterium]
MGITLKWDNEEKSIIYACFEPGWTWNDFYEMNQQFVALSTTVSHPVVFIANVTEAGLPKSFISQLPQIAAVSEKRPENLAYTVVVGARGLLDEVARIFSRVYRQAARKVIFVPTLEEAYAVIAQRGQEPPE